MSEKAIGGNMRLFETYWGQEKTFKLMPVTLDCPYMEALYHPSAQMLVVFSKTMKENYEMLPKLDQEGEMIKAKKPKRNGAPMQEERRLLKVPQEFYMINRKEQEAFIELFATNTKEFDYKKTLDIKPKEDSAILQKEGAGGLLDEKGNPMVAVK